MPSPDAIAEQVLRTLRRAALPDAYVRVTVTRGTGGVGLAPPGGAPTVVVAALPARPLAPADSGIAAALLRERRGAAGGGQEYELAAGRRGQAQRRRLRGRARALYVSASGNVLEGVASNVFAVIDDGRLLTPPVRHCLPGITRGRLLELARAHGLEVLEAPLPLDALMQAERCSSPTPFRVYARSRLSPAPRLAGRAWGACSRPCTTSTRWTAWERGELPGVSGGDGRLIATAARLAEPAACRHTLCEELPARIDCRRVARSLEAETFLFLLDSAGEPRELGRHSILAWYPRWEFLAKDGLARAGPPGAAEPLAGPVLVELERTLAALSAAAVEVSGPGEVPPVFKGGAVGFFAYELLHEIEDVARSAAPDLGVADCHLLFCDLAVVTDELRRPQLDRQQRLGEHRGGVPRGVPRAARRRAGGLVGAEARGARRPAARRPTPGAPVATVP